ncbi:MAG TPA: LysR substrate-binding domain-containing protein [Chloroflexota bacterium]|nr:LysR substrate-binding domain-containing protein [Chloroflexota bacterium]
MLNAPASLYHLQTFHAVATERSLARAAARRQLPEAVVHGHLRALERHYGTPLIAVRHRRVYLTDAGATLYEYAERLFSLLDDAERVVSASAELADGQLALWATSTIANYLLPPVLASFTRAYPGVRVAVSVGTSTQTLAHVLAQEVPFGLVAVPVSQPELVVQPFATDEMVLITLPEHPWAGAAALRLDALDGAPFLRREAGSATRSLVDSRLASVGVSVATAMELGSSEALKQAVLADVGVAWVPRLTVLRELAAGTLVAVPVPDIDLRRPLSIVALRDAPLTAAANELFRLLHVVNPLGPEAADESSLPGDPPTGGLSFAQRPTM